MKKLLTYWGLLLLPLNAYTQAVHQRTLQLMGSRFDITVVATNSGLADQYIDMAVSEIKRIEKLISSWDPDSQTSLINRQAGKKPVKVDPELFNLIQRSMAISRLTNGAFDISYASMDRIWKFNGDQMAAMPSDDLIRASIQSVGYRYILLDSINKTVFLEKPGAKIGFGAIGKGYAADKAKELLIAKGVPAGIINASGDMSTWGRHPDGSDWKVAITNPLNKNKAFATLPISEGAVVTSGDYEKYLMINGKRYAHIIDPRTGYPSTGILSVTVFASKAELADALATAVFVMGPEVGIDRINQIPEVECIIIDDQGKIHTSKNIEINKL